MIGKALRKGKQYMNPVPTSVGGWSTFFYVLWAYLTNREERTPKRSLGPFRTDARVYENPPASGLRVTWMGHSSTLLEIDGLRVLIDPVWEQRAAPFEWAGPKRFFAPPLRLEEMPRIDVVLLSHDHYDHLGAHTIKHLAQSEATAGAQWVTPLGVGEHPQKAGREGCARIGLDREPAGGRAGVDRAAVAPLLWTESLEPIRDAVGFVCSRRPQAPRLLRGGFRGVGGIQRDWASVWALRPDDVGDWSLRSPVGRYSHGTGWSGENISSHGRHGVDDAHSLGTVLACAAWLAAADRAGICR